MHRVMDMLRRLESVLATKAGGWIMGAVGLLVYLLAYLADRDLPGNHATHPADAWWGWWDQGQYLKTTVAIANGQLSSDSLWYPIGYSLLAVPFWYVVPKHAYLVPDMLLVGIMALAIWRIARLHLTRLQTAGLALVFLVTHPWTMRVGFVIPWTTIPTATAAVVSIWLLLTRGGTGAALALAGVASAAYWFRPSDAAALAPILVVSVLRLPDWATRLRAGSLGMGIIAASVLGVGLLNLAVVGSWQTAYDRVSGDIGFLANSIFLKAHWIFIDPTSFFGEDYSGLLLRFPWLIAAPAAGLLLIRKHGLAGWAIVAMIVLHLALYLGYNDFHPANLLRFKLIHYVAWVLPVLFVLTGAAVIVGWRDLWTISAMCGGIGTAVLSMSLQVRFEPVPVERGGDGWSVSDERPLLVEFPGVPAEPRPRVFLGETEARALRDYSMPWQPSHFTILLARESPRGVLTLPDRSALQDSPPTTAVMRWGWALPLRLLPPKNPRP